MLQEEFGSDTDDDDYVPEGEGHDASEEEHSGDEENPPAQETSKQKRKKKGKAENVFARGAFPSSESSDWKKDLEEEKKEKEELKEKKKVEDLWAEFKSDVGSKAKPGVEPKKACGSAMSSLFSTATSSTKPKAEPKPKSRLSSLFDPSPVAADEKPKPAKSSKINTFGDLFEDKPSVRTEPPPPEKGSSDTTKADNSNKMEITKVFDFAGEVVKVTKEVDADSEEAKKFLKKQEEVEKKGVKRTGGLASVVGNIGKKTKMGCLDKSKLDWNAFVAEEGIKEELSSFNRGKDGYVEKQMFLERADLRQFEKEKEIRDKNRKSLMK